MPPSLSAPTNVVVFQWPCGTGARQTLAPRRPASQACHLGIGSGLVDENQAFGVKIGLKFEPGFPPPKNIRTLLLACVCCFF